MTSVFLLVHLLFQQHDRIPRPCWHRACWASAILCAQPPSISKRAQPWTRRPLPPASVHRLRVGSLPNPTAQRHRNNSPITPANHTSTAHHSLPHATLCPPPASGGFSLQKLLRRCKCSIVVFQKRRNKTMHYRTCHSLS